MTRVTLLLKTNEGGLWVVPQLLALRNAGASVTAVIPPGDGRLRRALDEHAVPVVESPFDFVFRSRSSTLLALLRLRRAILRTRPDVVFYHLYASALAARFSTIGRRVRRVHMVAGPLYLENSIIKAAERILMRFDDHLIAGSEYTARLYRAMGMPASRVSTVPYGVDLRTFSSGIVSARIAQEASSDPTAERGAPLVVVMVAYVYAPKSAVFPGVGIKGHDVCLEAWRTFSAEQPHARLVLVGGGFDEAGEQHKRVLIEQYRVARDPSIDWLEKVPDVRPYYSIADLSVSPSLSENHGAVLEASAMGLPSIVSDAGGLPETVTPASGWVVPAGDVGALVDGLRLAAAEHATGELARKGVEARRVMSANFDLEICASRVVEHVLADHPDVVTFTEQQCSVSGSGELVGRAPLGALETLALATPCTLVARVRPHPEPGVPLLPGARAEGIIWTGSKALLRLVWQVWSTVGRHRVVVVYLPGLLGVLAGAVARLRGRRLVAVVVGNAAQSLSPSVVPGWQGLVARLVLHHGSSWVARRADIVRYVTAQALQQVYPIGRHGRAIAASDVNVSVTAAQPRQRPEGTVRVLTVASLDQPYKGVPDLVEAIERVRRAGADVTLQVAGTGQLLAEIERRVTAQGVSVEFLGHLCGDDLRQAYESADAFALASWTEGMPRALIEAMSHGLPAVATDVGGVAEVLNEPWVRRPRDAPDLAHGLLILLSPDTCWSVVSADNLARASRLCDSAVKGDAEFVSAVTGLLKDLL